MDELEETVRTYEANAETFGERYRRYSVARSERDRFADRLPGDRVLDAGCGPGVDLATFADAGLDPVGVDLSPSLLRLAREQVPAATLFRMDLRELGFRQNSFDGVWACASLVHVPKTDAEATLRGFERVLADGGRLFVSVKRRVGDESAVPDDRRFFVAYEPDELAGLAESAGFETLDLSVDDGWVVLLARR